MDTLQGRDLVCAADLRQRPMPTSTGSEIQKSSIMAGGQASALQHFSTSALHHFSSSIFTNAVALRSKPFLLAVALGWIYDCRSLRCGYDRPIYQACLLPTRLSSCIWEVQLVCLLSYFGLDVFQSLTSAAAW